MNRWDPWRLAVYLILATFAFVIAGSMPLRWAIWPLLCLGGVAWLLTPALEQDFAVAQCFGCGQEFRGRDIDFVAGLLDQHQTRAGLCPHSATVRVVKP